MTSIRPSKHVVLRYKDPDSTVGGSETSNSRSESPVSRSSPGSDLTVDLGPSQQYLDSLNSYRLEQDDEWNQTADKINNILDQMKSKWLKLEESRKRLFPESDRLSSSSAIRVSKKRGGITTSPRRKGPIVGS
jgi:hypothetical protein